MEETQPADRSDTEASIEFTDPSFNVYDFQETFNDNMVIKYQILKMNNSNFIWIGTNNSPKFGDLTFSMKTPYDSLPVSTHVFGSSSESPSINLATRLAKRCNKPVFVSFNAPKTRFSVQDIEKRLLEEYKNHPDIL